MAGPTRFELATSGVTGRRSNQLNYDPALRPTRACPGRPLRHHRGSSDQPKLAGRHCERRLVGGTGLEPVTAGV